MIPLTAAPLEGITGATFRRVHLRMFGGCARYYAPFFHPVRDPGIAPKDLKQLLPEENPGQRLVPQMLTNVPEEYFAAEKILLENGYEEVNLNFGCPSATVVPKGRGAGMLENPEKTDAFLDSVFSRARLKISVKSRIGLTSADELPDLMEVFNRYPISELILHPRVASDFYRGEPDTEAFAYAYSCAKMPLAYNGNVTSKETLDAVLTRFPKVSSVMIGRGFVANPSLFLELNGGKRLTEAEFCDYHLALYEENEKALSGWAHLLPRMKELWFYFTPMFENCDRQAKKVLKAKNPADYLTAARAFFAECRLKPM